jgi:hypothetical protein
VRVERRKMRGAYRFGWIRDGLEGIFCVFTLKDEVRVQVRGGLELP